MGGISLQDRHESGRKVAILGIVGNFILLAGKIITGMLTGSQAMLADGINSAGDVFSSLMTYIGSHIAGQPEDHDHPFGHGKSEYIFSFIIGISMLLAASVMIRSAVLVFLAGETARFSVWLVAVVVATILMKTGLYLYTRRQYKMTESLLIRANAEDHRNDCAVITGARLRPCWVAAGAYRGWTASWACSSPSGSA